MAETDPKTNSGNTDVASMFKIVGKAYDRDLRGVTSPFRREIDPDATNKEGDNTGKDTNKINKSRNTFDILSYQWYPSDIKRRFADDYYNNIDIAFAKVQSATSGGLLGGIKDAVMGQVDAIGNTLTDSVNGIKDSINSVKDMFNGNKKVITKTLSNQFNDLILTFPYAKVYEFKPQDKLGASISALSTAFKMIDNIVDGGAGFKSTVQAILDGVHEFILSEFKIDIKNPTQLADPNFRIYGLPNKLYKNIISGYYTGYYEIPLLENGDYLSSKGSTGWEAQGFVDRFFGAAGGTIKGFMTDSIGSGLDIATRPKWSISGGGEPFKDITIRATLFNDNITAVFNNLAFIHSFVGGNQWYQDTLIQKCSSLYDVELPGRLRYYFCTCDIEVNFVGKVRVLSRGLTETGTMDTTRIREDLDDLLGLNNVAFNMNPHVLNTIPDIYEITFTFRSLLPNNYNTYYAYLQGSEEDAVQGVGSQINNMWEQLAKSVDAKVTAANVNK